MNVDTTLDSKNLILIVNEPSHVVERTTGQVRVLISSARFVWGSKSSRDSHPLADHEGAAKKISKGSSGILYAETNSFRESINTSPSAYHHQQSGLKRGIRPAGIGDKPMIEYKLADLVELIQWIRSDGCSRTRSVLFNEALAELGLPGLNSTGSRLLGQAIDAAPPPPSYTPESGRATRPASRKITPNKKNTTTGATTARQRIPELDAATSSETHPTGGTSMLPGQARQHTYANPTSLGGEAEQDYTLSQRVQGEKARAYLRKLANALAKRGVETRSQLNSDRISVIDPSRFTTVSGFTEVSVSNGYFVWDIGALHVTHPVKDHEGAAAKLADLKAAGADDKAPHIKESQPTTDPDSPTHEQEIEEKYPRPQGIGNRAITAYRTEELAALVRWLISSRDVGTYDKLINESLAELCLPGRTPKRVQLIEEAAVQAGWRASAATDDSASSTVSRYNDVVRWAREYKYPIETDKEIPAHLVYQYNLTHPTQPYSPRKRKI
ncbi:hypothetical protein AB0J63_16660 [Streptosporangium canum]|uniref:hypothetical protein n=1 Tax=Streptosporangium canum TaxID=324952 RepID=UPI0034168A14